MRCRIWTDWISREDRPPVPQGSVQGGADLISDDDMAGVDRHMKQHRSIVMNLPAFDLFQEIDDESGFMQTREYSHTALTV
jgi:hypothetical protein